MLRQITCQLQSRWFVSIRWAGYYIYFVQPAAAHHFIADSSSVLLVAAAPSSRLGDQILKTLSLWVFMMTCLAPLMWFSASSDLLLMPWLWLRSSRTVGGSREAISRLFVFRSAVNRRYFVSLPCWEVDHKCFRSCDGLAGKLHRFYEGAVSGWHSWSPSGPSEVLNESSSFDNL